MLPVFTIFVPVFSLILIGWLMGRFAGFATQHYQGIAALTFNLLVPALLFYGSFNAEWPSKIPWGLFGSYYLPQLAIFILAWCLCGWRLTGAEKSCVALGSTYSNNVLIGIPCILAVFGDEALAPAFLIIGFHSALLFTISGLALELGQKQGPHWKAFLKALFNTITTPLVASILLGVLAKLLELELPRSMVTILEWLGDAAIPCSLLVLGIALAKYSLKGIGFRVIVMSALKVILMPLLVWVMTWYWWRPSDYEVGAVVILLAATPVGINAYAFAHQHKQAEPQVAAAVLLSTMLASITMSMWLAALLLPKT
ncbi:AEC family transporter [Corallincola platygyrae]|uniref:AEC family transporter n=1 Tax=Corallincola platygyrae TaxID=1193278 RepID=A0ABW4XN17_9GAMM